MTGRSSSVPVDEELRLPRTPGVIRRFWARHPLFADVLIAVVCFVLSAAPTTVVRFYDSEERAAYSGTTIAGGVVILTAVLVACVLLVRRRRWPLIAFIAAWTVSLVYLSTLQPAGGLLLLVASYSLAVHRSTRAAWIGFAVGVCTYSAVCLALFWAGPLSLQNALNGIAGQLVVALIGTLIGANVGGRKRYLEAVIDRSRQLLVERDQQAQIAAAGERARIAREMHDIVSHSLTVVVALSEGAAATDNRQRARDASTAAAQTARSALTEMRAMLGVLRDGSDDAPLAPAEPVSPHETVAAARRAGYPVTLTTAGSAEMPSAIGFAVGRIVQEGVTNAMRHAPQAQSITVRIAYGPDAVVIDIENDGVGGAEGSSGFGIRGLQERAAHAGGTLVSRATETGRWMLHAELPAHGEDDRDRRDQH